MHRLLFLTENYPPDRGGMAESCDRIVRSLSTRGVRIDLVHFDRRASKPIFRQTEFGSFLRWPSEISPAHTINLLWNRIRQAIDLNAITHVVAFGGAMPIAAAPLFASMARRPLLTFLRGSEIDLGLFDPRRRPFLEDALRRSAAVCAVTREQEEKVNALFQDAPVYFVPNGINFDLWLPSNADRERAAKIRRRWTPPRVIGMFGDLKVKKGIPFLLEVFDRCRLHERFHLLLIGEADEELTSFLAAHPDLPVTMHPPRDRYELMPFYLACDFVALPSHYDGCPNVLIEAATLGIPAIGAAVGGMRDLIEDGKTGLLFPPGDEHGARRALALAANMDDAALATMRKATAEHARQRCNAADEAIGYLRVLDQTRSNVRVLHAAE